LQTTSLDALAIQLLAHGYRRCYFRELNCLRCGTWRIALSALSGERITDPACPQCHGSVPVSPILCWGFTRQETPFYERFKAPLSVNSLIWVNTQVDDDERDRRRVQKERAKGKPRATHYAAKPIPESHFADNPRFA
jgi:hypothetical protein